MTQQKIFKSNTQHILQGSEEAPCTCVERDIYPGSCMICDGGLSFCVVCCGGGESDLPTRCPGRVMTREEMYQVRDGSLDWVQP